MVKVGTEGAMTTKQISIMTKEGKESNFLYRDKKKDSLKASQESASPYKLEDQVYECVRFHL